MEDDWRFFINSPRGGGWLAEKNGAVVGTVAFLRFEPGFSWLSMMLVDPNERRAGIGSQLMEAALDALESAQAVRWPLCAAKQTSEACVRLDATPFGEPLYRHYGFVPEYELARAIVMVTTATHVPAPANIRPTMPGDFADIFAKDRRIFGADRSALLASFHQRAPELAWVARHNADVLGYCFGRPGFLYRQLGPIVAENAEIARSLLSQCLLEQEGKRIAVDVPAFAVEWIRWLESGGFRIERRFLRMRRGENPGPGSPDRQFAIAGPEFG